MRETVPTVEEIRELKELVKKMSYQELAASGILEDSRKRVMRSTMTEILLRNTPKELEENIWKLCKKLAGFAHAPVSLAEYKRVRPYAEDSGIVDVVLSGLRENYYPFSGLLPDIQGYYYCIALVSQSQYRRADCIAYLTELTDYFIANLPDELDVLGRNMKVLKKEYKDLEVLEQKLSGL